MIKHNKKKKIALFHPWLKSKGGAEKVVLEILKSKKYDFDVYTWVYDEKKTFPEFKEHKINVLAPKIGKKVARLHILRGLFLFLGLFKKIPLKKYDKFLISTSGVGEFITFRNRKKRNTYAYVHTPLREANKNIIKWNLKNRYNSLVKKQIYLMAVKIYKIFEKMSWKKIDYVIFNSELSFERAKEHNLLKNKKTEVIYPLLNTKRFAKSKKSTSKNFVYVSRLNPPKRQDVLIQAWKKFIKKNPQYTLTIAGNADNKKYYNFLLDLTKNQKSIKIKEKISNKELEKLISNSFAGIFLGYQEDFGIVPLEILAAEKPLLAVDEGGYMVLIKNHPNLYKIKEKHNNKEMIEEINKTFNDFLKKKGKAKKNRKKKNTENSTYNFKKKIEKVLTQ